MCFSQRLRMLSGANAHSFPLRELCCSSSSLGFFYLLVFICGSFLFYDHLAHPSEAASVTGHYRRLSIAEPIASLTLQSQRQCVFQCHSPASKSLPGKIVHFLLSLCGCPFVSVRVQNAARAVCCPLISTTVCLPLHHSSTPPPSALHSSMPEEFKIVVLGAGGEFRVYTRPSCRSCRSRARGPHLSLFLLFLGSLCCLFFPFSFRRSRRQVRADRAVCARHLCQQVRPHARGKRPV